MFATSKIRSVCIWSSWLLVAALSLITSVHAQFPQPASLDGVTTIQSPADGNITISYKSPPIGTCTTVFATQQQYSGYISLPPNVLNPSQGNYPINTFFWFFEARQLPESAPLTIYLNGGPGSSSMVGLFQEVGPCQVVEIAQDTLGTIERDWGWDRSSNILFIDQPAQVGFSYDTATNFSLNLLDEQLVYPPGPVPVPQPPYTFVNGTFGSGNPTYTTNTTQLSAFVVWHFLQAFLSTFPQYSSLVATNTSTTSSAEINLFTESYGGKYVPAFAKFFQSQNALRATDPAFANSTIDISVTSVGIINGWIDLFVQTPYQPRFAYNNTYNIQAISQVQELNALSAYLSADGCQDLTITCRALESSQDPMDNGAVQSVNQACSQAQAYCQEYVSGPYTQSGRSIYDISQSYLDPFPDSHYLEYLNTAAVQQAIGVPVNYTQASGAVEAAFANTGDYARNSILGDIVELIQSGVRVALIYGDRDFVCNWQSGEAISFAIAGMLGPAYSPWYTAGYSAIVTNGSYVGGVVREFGNLSFSRIYNAGHLVPAYQPETAFTVFSRIIEGTEISLGIDVDLSQYASSGDPNSTYQNTAPPQASPTCFLRAVNSTCNTDQKNMLANYAGVIINGVLYESESDWTPPGASVSSAAGVPGTAPASMMTSAPHATTVSSMSSHTSLVTSSPTLPTGVYTATGLPTTTTSSVKNEATMMKSNILLKDTQPAFMMLGLLSLGVIQCL